MCGRRRVASVLHQHLRDLSTAVTHYEFALAGPGDLQAEWHVLYMAGNAYLTLGYQVMPPETTNETQKPQRTQRLTRLLLHACACTPALARLLLHACACTPALARLLLHACSCTPALTDQEKALGLYARASLLNPTFASADREAAIACTVMGNTSKCQAHPPKKEKKKKRTGKSHLFFFMFVVERARWTLFFFFLSVCVCS
jgi:hypothetical protein